MRTRIPRLCILFLLSVVTPAMAQLSPGILADAHLLRVEQAILEGDPNRARAVIDQIILLGKEHELDLSDEFHFRYAKAADSVDLPEQALESIVKYLTATGREGQHYVEALELMTPAENGIAGRKAPQADSPGSTAPPTTETPTETLLETGDTADGQKEQVSAVDPSGTPEAPVMPECDLSAWNTEDYFKTAAVEGVKNCLAAGANPMERGRYQSTPLHLAARNANLEVVRALLAAGADPMARDRSESTPLHRAAGNANLEVVRALLAAGADPMARTDYESTPLHLAARNANLEVVRVLLAAGADPMARDRSEYTPLHRAAGRANPEVVRALLAAGADPMARAQNGITPLYLAATNTNPEVVRALLAAGADPMARVQNGVTPLYQAAMNTNPANLETLLAAGASAEARIHDGRTPLHWAAKFNDNLAMIALLLKAGANLEARDEWGRTPLHEAADYSGTALAIKALLAAGANLEARDENGDTPLHRAAAYSDYDDAHAGAAIEVLLAAGANPLARNRAGKTPWGLAQANEQLKKSDAYWRLNDARFEVPGAGAASTTVDGSQSNALGPASGGQCEIPGYPRPANVQHLGLSWCPATVDFQVRSLALQAAGAKCAIATGSSSTPAQIQARQQEIQAACARLAVLGVSNCRCP